MAKLSPSAFAAKWTPLLANNVFQDIDGTRLGLLVADIRDSFAASTDGVNVPDWKPDTYYPYGFVILHGVTNTFYKALEAGYLDSPSSEDGDVYWEATLSPVDDNALYQVGTVPALRLARGRWALGRLYVLNNRTDPDSGEALSDVYVRALSAGALEPNGFTLDNASLAAVPVPVSYDLVTDVTSPVVAGPGDGYSKDEVNALLDEKGSQQVQAQHTQQLSSLTPLVPAKATASNQLATLADIGQIGFVDVPLALSNGRFRLPVDCAGKRFIIEAGTADTAISTAAFTNLSVGKVFAISISHGVAQQVRAVAFGQELGGDVVGLGETALLLVGKQAAGPGFYYNAFKIGTPPAVKSVNGALPDAAGNVVVAAGNGYSDAQAAAAALASLVAGNGQHQGVQVSDVNGVPKLTVAGAVTDIVRLRMPASGAGNLAEGQDLRDADAGGSYRLTATANVARFAIINPAGPITLFDGKATDYPAGGVPLQGATWFTYQVVSVDVTQPVFLELSLIH